MQQLYIYLLQQDDNTSYDTYDSCVVVSDSEDNARLIRPSTYQTWENNWNDWANSPESVTVTYLGEADESLKLNEVICSSFNAG